MSSSTRVLFLVLKQLNFVSQPKYALRLTTQLAAERVLIGQLHAISLGITHGDDTKFGILYLNSSGDWQTRIDSRRLNSTEPTPKTSFSGDQTHCPPVTLSWLKTLDIKMFSFDYKLCSNDSDRLQRWLLAVDFKPITPRNPYTYGNGTHNASV